MQRAASGLSWWHLRAVGGRPVTCRTPPLRTSPRCLPPAAGCLPLALRPAEAALPLLLGCALPPLLLYKLEAHARRRFLEVERRLLA